MKRQTIRGVGVAVFAAAWGSAPAVFASDMEDTAFILSAERVGTAAYTSIGGDADSDRGTIALLGQGGNTSPYSMPRFAFDGVIARHLTVGGSLTFSKYFLDPQEYTLVTLAPRVGFLTALGGSADLWVKGGFTYYNASADSGLASNDENGLALSLALDFNVALADHFGILIGPSIDQALTGGTDNFDIEYSTYGLNIGVAGWL